ncbi:efflux RND transporter periplasmic adaptor subunit [Candidatus Kaiserbacteria bacterium]|nr:efflux RND transporter periplasmic adaptor subunit [Candidatus Kaiserbacteria bacterium]
MILSLRRLAARGWRYALALAVVLFLAWFFFGRGGASGATLSVRRANVVERVNVSGTVTAKQDVRLGFAANGRISGTYAAVGQRVRAGTMLAQIENGDLAAALSQKQAALKKAQADLASLKAGTRSEEVAVAAIAVTNARAGLLDSIRSAYTTADDTVRTKVDQFFSDSRSKDPRITFLVSNMTLKSALERDRVAVEETLAAWALMVARLTNDNAAASAKQAQAYLARVLALLNDASAAVNQGLPSGTVTAASLTSYGTDIAAGRTSINAAAAAITADSATLDSAEKTLALKQAGPTLEAVAAEEAAVAAAQAEVASAAAALAETRVVAPFDGIVTRMDAKAGSIVSPSDALISMQSDGLFQIETFVPEVAIGTVTVGNTATTTLDAYGSGAAFPAKVIAVDPAETVKDGVPTYKTTLAFLSRDSRIRSGMTADVVITTGTLSGAIVIPIGAVGEGVLGKFVTVVVDGRTENRPVTTGRIPSTGQIEIVSGLEEGDVIRLSPLLP